MSVKHTPSPWRIKKDLQQGGAGISIWGDGTGILAFLTSVRLDSGRLSANEADAALIAAAPELLEALEALQQYTHEITDEGRNLEDPDDIEDYGKLRTQAAAAIAKARGGA